MSNEKIAKILKDHHHAFYIKGGRIFADSLGWEVTDWENGVDDLTGYTLKQLRDWLGY